MPRRAKPRSRRRKVGVSVLDEFIERFGLGAILSVDPYVGDSGETLRWIITIDGHEVSDADVRVEEHPERAGVTVMSLVSRDEEIELARWSTDRYPHGHRVVRTLREIRAAPPPGPE
jgi:hypothetical protein